MGNCRLHTNTDEAAGVLDGCPGMAVHRSGDAVAASIIVRVEFRAVIHQQLHYGIAPFVRSAVEGLAAIAIPYIRIEPQVEQHLYGFEVCASDHS